MRRNLLQLAAAVMVIYQIAILLPGCAPGKTVDITSLMEDADRLFLEGKYEEAILNYEQIIKIEPRNTQAYLGLANALASKGEIKKAADMLLTGIEKGAEEETLSRLLEELRARLEAPLIKPTPSPLAADQPTRSPMAVPTDQSEALSEENGENEWNETDYPNGFILSHSQIYGEVEGQIMFEYRPIILLYEDGTFRMTSNELEYMDIYEGVYTKQEKIISFSIKDPRGDTIEFSLKQIDDMTWAYDGHAPFSIPEDGDLFTSFNDIVKGESIIKEISERVFEEPDN